MTGAPLPEGADCVLMQELTNSGEETVQLYAAMKPQQNVVFRGGDIAAGAVIAEAGTVLSPPISACWPGRDTLKSPFTRR